MIVMRVGDDDRIGRLVWQRAEIRQGVESRAFGVHAGIQHDTVIPGFEEVGIGADLASARQVTKTHSGGVKREADTRGLKPAHKGYLPLHKA